MTKKNFQFNEQVQVFNTGSTYLDGKIGRITGVAGVHLVDTYIVTFSNSLKVSGKEFSSVVVAENCLKSMGTLPGNDSKPAGTATIEKPKVECGHPICIGFGKCQGHIGGL